MALGAKKIIGLAMGERVIHAAEIRVAGARRAVGCAAAFELPPSASLDDAAALGAALKQHLASQGFRGREAVIGLPGVWLMAKRQSVPPAAPETALAGMLRLQAERQFAAETRDLVVDYAADTTGGPRDSVLLVAAARKRMNQAVAIAQAAGLKVLAVTSSSAALAMAEGGDGASRLVVQVSPTSVELAVREGGRFASVQHVQLPDTEGAAASADSVANELRRLIAAGGMDESSGGNAGMTVWDGVGLTGEAMHAIGSRTMLDNVRRGELSMLAELNGLARPEMPGRFAAAVALARAGVDRALMPVDFLHSRLAPVKKSRFDKRLRIPAIVAAIAVLAIGWLVLDWNQQSAEVAELAQRIDAQKPDVKRANEMVTKVRHAEGWFANRPRTLDVLRDLTLAFPEEGRIWINNLSLREDMVGTLTGGARDNQIVLETINKMKASGVFLSVKLLGMRETAKGRGELTFSIGFQYVPRKG